MSYETTKEINIRHTTDDFGYTFTADEYGTVCITEMQGIGARTGKTTYILVRKDCISHFINALKNLYE